MWAAAVEASDAAVSDLDALQVLLGAEGFLFAAISLSVTLATPQPHSNPRFPSLKSSTVIWIAIGLLVLLGGAATSIWVDMYGSGSYVGHREAVVPGALLLAIVGQPLIALLLALAAAAE